MQSLAPPFRHTTTPALHRSIFTGSLLFLTPKQQCHSSEGKINELDSDNIAEVNTDGCILQHSMQQACKILTSVMNPIL